MYMGRNYSVLVLLLMNSWLDAVHCFLSIQPEQQNNCTVPQTVDGSTHNNDIIPNAVSNSWFMLYASILQEVMQLLYYKYSMFRTNIS